VDLPKLILADFSGGFTDQYLGAPQTKCERNTNLELTPDKKLASRPGSVLWDTTNYQLPSGNQRVGKLFSYDNDTNLLAQSARKVFTYSAGWTELTGPSGNPALAAGTTANHVNYGAWKKHLFLTSDSGGSVMKIYKDSGGTFRVRTAGLPEVAETANYVSATVLASAIALANSLRTHLKAHFVNTNFAIHAVTDTASNTAISLAACTNLPTLLALTAQMKVAYNQHERDSEKAVPAYHTFTNQIGGQKNPILYVPVQALANTNAPTTLLEACADLDELRKNFNAHDGDLDIHQAIGAEQVSVSPIGELSSGPSVSRNVATLYNLANALKASFNAHIFDAGPNMTGTITSASPTITLVADTTNVTVGDKLAPNSGFGPTVLEVVSKTLTTITMSGNATTSASGALFLFAHTDSAHFGQDANGSSSPYVSAADATTLDTCAVLLRELRFKYFQHLVADATYYLHVAVDTVNTLQDWPFFAADGATFGYMGDWNQGMNDDQIEYMQAAADELKTKFNLHVVSEVFHWPFGESAVNKLYNNVVAESVAFASYQYAFHYFYEYTVGTETFQDFGPVLIKEVANVPEVTAADVSIANIPAITNGATENYDTASIKVYVYRTKNSGVSFYKVGEVTNGTTTFTDTVRDDQLSGGLSLYTDSGIVDNDPPPVSRFIHLANNKAYYGYITEGTEVRSNRIRESILNDPDSAPEDFYVDLEEDVTGISSFSGRILGFTDKGVYRLDGGFDEKGRGGLTYEKIFTSDGCVSHGGIVQIPEGVVFPGNFGFYFTDGYQTFKINVDWVTTYKTLVASSAQAKKIRGTYDSANQRVYWSAQSALGSDNDVLYVLELKQGMKPDACFFSGENGSSFAPTDLLFYNKQLLRADTRGYVFKHDSTYTSDPKVDTAVAGSLWAKKTITYDFISAGLDFGDPLIRKWVPRFYFKAKNKGDLSLQINSINDDHRSTKACKPIRVRSYTGVIEGFRRMPAGGLRCSYKQLELTNAKVVITNSDTLGLATISASTVTIAGTWPTDPIDHVIAFETDSYVTEYPITARTATQLTVTGAPGNAVGKKWVIRGYPKDEKLEFHSLTFTYLPISNSQRAYQATVTDTGANA
jgi:hypothetical protein